MNTRVSVAYIILGLFLAVISAGISYTPHGAEARTEQLSDISNNDLIISMEAPDFWNSGIISQTVASLEWRLNGLDATNDDLSAFFIVVNTPSAVNIALPLGQETGILSLLLSQYVTINAESDLTLSDGSAAHRYSITITPDQLHRLNAPIDKGFDGIMISTKQQGITYFIIYASELGKMSQFENVFQNILDSVQFGSVGFTGTEFNNPNNGTIDSAVTDNNPAYGVLGSAHVHAAFAVKMNGAQLDFSDNKYQIMSRYIHVENGDGNTLHRHATGVSIAEFFKSIKMDVTDNCFTDDNGTKYCSNGQQNLEFYVNGNKTNSIADYVFNDDDRILIVYGDSPIQVKQDLDQLQQSPIFK